MSLRKRCIVVAGIAVGGMIVAAPTAFADEPSCVGAGSSAVAPGQGFGYPGIRADISHFTKFVADILGTTPGALVSTTAHEHGSAPECFPEGPPLP